MLDLVEKQVRTVLQLAACFQYALHVAKHCAQLVAGSQCGTTSWLYQQTAAAAAYPTAHLQP
jgi:hypothetical protein